MAIPGPTTRRNVDRLAGNLLRLARADAHLSQRALAASAGVPQSTIGRIEAGAMQPTIPLLYRLLAAAGAELRVRLEPYDDHDDVLDALAAARPADQTGAAEQARRDLIARHATAS